MLLIEHFALWQNGSNYNVAFTSRGRFSRWPPVERSLLKAVWNSASLVRGLMKASKTFATNESSREWTNMFRKIFHLERGLLSGSLRTLRNGFHIQYLTDLMNSMVKDGLRGALRRGLGNRKCMCICAADIFATEKTPRGCCQFRRSFIYWLPWNAAFQRFHNIRDPSRRSDKCSL